MDFEAFHLIVEKLTEPLLAQGFSGPEDFAVGNGKAVLFSTDDLAYSVLYDMANKRFQLRSASMEDGNPGKWKTLSTWMFDPESDKISEAENIINDFLETVEGPKRIEAVRKATGKKHKKKEEGNNADPIFLFNRLAGIFPELKEEMAQERITYGKIREFTFARDHVAAKVEDLAKNYKGSEPFKKLCTVLNDLYKNGDMDTRSVITMVILNNVNDETAISNLREEFKDDLAKCYKYGRNYRDKTVKPEKKKKQKKIVAQNLNEMDR